MDSHAKSVLILVMILVILSPAIYRAIELALVIDKMGAVPLHY